MILQEIIKDIRLFKISTYEHNLAVHFLFILKLTLLSKLLRRDFQAANKLTYHSNILYSISFMLMSIRISIVHVSIYGNWCCYQ